VAGPISLRTHVNAGRARVAAPIELRVTIEAPAASEVTEPEFGDRVGSFDVIDTVRIDDLPAAASGSTRRWLFVIRLESLYPGQQTIPPLQWTVRHGSRDYRLASRPIGIIIDSVRRDEEAAEVIRDLKPVMEPAEPAAGRRYLLPGLVSTLAIAFAAAVVTTVRRRRPGAAATAFRQIDSVAQEVDGITDVEAHAALSRILRQYLEASLGIPATAQTGPELAHRLDRHPRIGNQLVRSFESLAGSADRVRYATGSHEHSAAEIVEQYRKLIEDFERSLGAAEGR
jgi:hypothetical protein